MTNIPASFIRVHVRRDIVQNTPDSGAEVPPGVYGVSASTRRTAQRGDKPVQADIV